MKERGGASRVWVMGAGWRTGFLLVLIKYVVMDVRKNSLTFISVDVLQKITKFFECFGFLG